MTHETITKDHRGFVIETHEKREEKRDADNTQS
jgi:hypothetical protein